MFSQVKISRQGCVSRINPSSHCSNDGSAVPDLAKRLCEFFQRGRQPFLVANWPLLVVLEGTSRTPFAFSS